MIRVGSLPVTLHRDDFEELAYLHGATVDLPGNRAGWAVCSVLGTTYRTWMEAPKRVQS